MVEKETQTQKGLTKTSPAGRDQLASDVKGAVGFMDKIFARISGPLTPVVSGGTTKLKGLGGPAKSLLGGKFVKKIARVFAAFLIIIVVLLIVFKVARFVRDKEKEAGEVALTSPTIGPYQPFKPSVYAEDELVLEVEEDLQVLDRETSTTILKETTLEIPVLDFDINFKK